MAKLAIKITHRTNKGVGRFAKLLFGGRVCTCLGLPWWLSSKQSANQCRRCRFNPWVRKTPWRMAWQHTPIFLPGKSFEQRSLVGYTSNKESNSTEHSIGLPWRCWKATCSFFFPIFSFPFLKILLMNDSLFLSLFIFLFFSILLFPYLLFALSFPVPFSRLLVLLTLPLP